MLKRFPGLLYGFRLSFSPQFAVMLLFYRLFSCEAPVLVQSQILQFNYFSSKPWSVINLSLLQHKFFAVSCSSTAMFPRDLSFTNLSKY